jgi:hypothetical protein
LLSWAVFYAMVALLSANPVAYVFQPEFPGLFYVVAGHGKTWLVVLLGSLIGVAPDFVYEAVLRIFRPSPVDRVRAQLAYRAKVDSSPR